MDVQNLEISGHPRIRMIIPIWGRNYIERWLDLTFPALRSEGNIFYLNQHSDFELAILTMAADISYMQGDPRFNMLTASLRVKFIAMDEFFPPQGKTPYGVPLTLAYAKGILDLGENAIGTYIMIFNADATVASGSFKSVFKRILDGYTAIGAPGLRANDGATRAELYNRVDKATGVLSISPREMVRLAIANLHGTVLSRMINESGAIDSFYFHQLYWRVSENCIASRGFLTHPLCFRIEQVPEKVLCPVDYGFITEMCPNARYYVMNDSDDFMALELQAGDSDDHSLRLSCSDENAGHRMARMASEIAAHAASWTTSEHRRSAMFTVLFHVHNLPADIEQRTAPFNAMIDSVLAKLPPPVSHIGHFQWLPAVHYYRLDMERYAGNPDIKLLDDPRNVIPLPPASPATPDDSPSAINKRKKTYPQWEQILYRLRFHLCRHELAATINARLLPRNRGLDVLFIDHINGHAKVPPGANIHDYGTPAGPDNNCHDFSVKSLPTNDAETLLIYAPAGFLSPWDRLHDDAQTFLEDYKQFVLVLVQRHFGALDIAGHSYMLSKLLNAFPPQNHDVSIDVYLAPDPRFFNITEALSRAASLLIGRNPKSPDVHPAEFSALVISVRRK